MSLGEELDTQENLPPSETYPEEPDMPPAPANSVGSIPRFRRELLSHKADLRSLLESLLAYQKAPSFEVTREVAIVLACAATDRAFPPLDSEEDYALGRALIAAKDGRLKGYAGLAIEIVENALKICISGVASLAMIDALDETVSGDYHNLHPSILARRLIRLGHSLSRGAIPGWREAGE